ncbi:hypothetical protein EYF80_006665 [Liparis tanakae]|uniref:Uncharacterized protein n=1 Tax=Liparis tanakae TaxID=230148 RepID=A0A4Z2J047_9TELE|nr:hypothetical protein EYF80_006665 [Liparis tanakae]
MTIRDTITDTQMPHPMARASSNIMAQGAAESVAPWNSFPCHCGGNCELTSCTARLPGEPGYLVTSSGLRSLCHICSRSVGVRAATISSCVRVTAR